MVKHMTKAAGGQAKRGKRDSSPQEPRDLGILLALAYSAFVMELRESLARAGYDDLHASFGYVARNLVDEPLTVTGLAERLGVTAPGALKIVRQMEERGYLESAPDADDARAKRLCLTPRGRAAL